MPQNKRESLIFTIIMCFTMVLWMSMYNVTLHMGGFSMTVLKEGWLARKDIIIFLSLRMAGIPLRLHLRHVL